MPEDNDSLLDRVKNSVKDALTPDKKEPEKGNAISNITNMAKDAAEKVQAQAREKAEDAREKAEEDSEVARLRKQVSDMEAEKAKDAAEKLAQSMSKTKPAAPSQGFQTPQNSNYTAPAQQAAPQAAQPAAPQAAQPAAPAVRTYTVVSGDSLSKIAKNFYGDASQWKKIHEANRDKISNPDLIHPGQEFIIP